MQAPLRRGKKETLGRASGITRTGRSLLFWLLLVVLLTGSSIVYTSQRLVVESMLRENQAIETALELSQKRAARLAYEVSALTGLARIRTAVAEDSSMVPMDWKDVVVIDAPRGVVR